MKINKAKLLVGTLAIAAVAATVGSISGTVAWFQYSTRASVSYQGATAHCSESLEVRIRNGTTTQYPWKTELASSDVSAYLSNATDHATAPGIARKNTTSLTPVTSGVLAANAFPAASTDYNAAPQLKRHPIYQHFLYSEWTAATAEDYVLIPLQVRVRDIDGTANKELKDKKIYISDVHLDGAINNGTKTDITSALRMSVRAYPSATTSGAASFFQTYSTTGSDVNVFGQLDLNNDGVMDGDDTYSWDTNTPKNYGADSGVAKSTANTNVANDSDAYTIVNSTPTALIGTTAEADKVINVDVLVYLEGWTKLDGSLGTYADAAAFTAAVTAPVTGGIYIIGSDYKQWDGDSLEDVTAPTETALWDPEKTISAQFNAGIRFSTEAHKNGEE